MYPHDKNSKVNSLLGIFSGLYLISIFLDPIIKCNVNLIIYIGIIFAILVVLLSVYKFLTLQKKEQINPNKKSGYQSLAIGILFLLSTLNKLITSKISIISATFGLAAGILTIILSIRLLKK